MYATYRAILGELTMGTLRLAELKPGRSMAKLACTGLVGTSVEWYDFFLYGTAAALVFPTVFFPKTLPPALALIASFSTFAVGFVARPIGAVIFGHFGDRAGRKTSLVAALHAGEEMRPVPRCGHDDCGQSKPDDREGSSKRNTPRLRGG
jgi:hypothetical protein